LLSGVSVGTLEGKSDGDVEGICDGRGLKVGVSDGAVDGDVLGIVEGKELDVGRKVGPSLGAEETVGVGVMMIAVLLFLEFPAPIMLPAIVAPPTRTISNKIRKHQN